MFALTKDQWQLNVQQAVAAGAARAMGSPETGFSMVMATQAGDILIVRPNYSQSTMSPDFLQMTVIYEGARAAVFTDAAIADAIDTASDQMSPEFTVIGNSERIEGSLVVFFIISN